MHAVKYNSGISGGSFPAVLYSYAQVPTEELLETKRSTDPSTITPELLATIPKTSMGYTFIKKKNDLKISQRFLVFLTKPTEVFRIFRGIFKVHSWWSRFIYLKHCKPLNIPKNKYFTSGPDELKTILEDNPNLKEKDFLLPRSDVKTMPMILWTMHGSRADANIYMNNYKKIKQEAWDDYKAEESLKYFTSKNFNEEARPDMTKMILGIRDKYNGNLPVPFIGTADAVWSPYTGTMTLRRSTVDFPIADTKPFEWGTRSRFSVENLIALSTNFPGSNGNGDGVGALVLPQLFSNVRKVKLTEDYTGTQLFADGGTNDLMGILPAIQKGVDKIIALYNFNQSPPYADFETTYADIYHKAPSTDRSDPNFDTDFRQWLSMINPGITCYFGFFGASLINHSNTVNHVFNDPNLDRLKELMVKLNSLFKADEPLIATLHDLETIDNPFWGVKGGKKVDITLMYFSMPKKFSEQVPEESVPPPEGMEKIDKDGRFNNELMRRLPELPNDPVSSMQYSPAQVNMMAYLGSWMVTHSWDGLKGHDGEIKFEGFAEIFENSIVFKKGHDVAEIV